MWLYCPFLHLEQCPLPTLLSASGDALQVAFGVVCMPWQSLASLRAPMPGTECTGLNATSAGSCPTEMARWNVQLMTTRGVRFSVKETRGNGREQQWT